MSVCAYTLYISLLCGHAGHCLTHKNTVSSGRVDLWLKAFQMWPSFYIFLYISIIYLGLHYPTRPSLGENLTAISGRLTNLNNCDVEKTAIICVHVCVGVKIQVCSDEADLRPTANQLWPPRLLKAQMLYSKTSFIILSFFSSSIHDNMFGCYFKQVGRPHSCSCVWMSFGVHALISKDIWLLFRINTTQ